MGTVSSNLIFIFPYSTGTNNLLNNNSQYIKVNSISSDN